jgi:hypothetical protein
MQGTAAANKVSLSFATSAQEKKMTEKLLC